MLKKKMYAQALFRHVAEALSGKFMANSNNGIAIRNGGRQAARKQNELIEYLAHLTCNESDTFQSKMDYFLDLFEIEIFATKTCFPLYLSSADSNCGTVARK